MFLKKLLLVDYTNFEHAELDFAFSANKKITILIGENGAGKSNILEAIATLLSWFTARLCYGDKASGIPIPESKVRLDQAGAFIQATFQSSGEDFSWHMVKNRKGQRLLSEISLAKETSLKEASLLATKFSERYTLDPVHTSLPLVAYYPATRYMLDVPRRVVTHHDFMPVDGYQKWSLKNSEWSSIAIDFRRFFEWFRNGDDLKNEIFSELVSDFSYFSFKNLNGLQRITKDNISSFINYNNLKNKNPELYEKFSFAYGPQLSSVSEAITQFMPGYVDLRITRQPLQMRVTKDGKDLDILQLSQGERSILALVADIAYRLAIMNPDADDPLQGEGIVLIDEIDLHLHPRWQRSIVRNLQTTFPNCQFIITTHSPLVVSDPQDVQIFLLEENSVKEISTLYGMDIEQVLSDIMGTALRYEPLQEQLDDLLKAAQNRDFVKYKELRNSLLSVLPSDHRELQRADIFKRRMEAIDAVHQKK